jgi:hypothetical protein
MLFPFGTFYIASHFKPFANLLELETEIIRSEKHQTGKSFAYDAQLVAN